MLRMMKMEFTIFTQYLKTMLFTMAFTMACIAVGMGTVTALPSIAFIMMMFGMSTTGSAYDEQNGWGAYRLALPVSRRDVVLGRYAFNLIVAIAAAAVTSVLVALLVGFGQAVPLTGRLAEMLSWGDEGIMPSLAGLLACACIGLALSSVTLPAYFKFGQTKATQWLPFIMLLLNVAPFVVIGLMGGEAAALLDRAMMASRQTGGFGALGLGVLAIALAAYAASAFVSVRLYEARDL